MGGGFSFNFKLSSGGRVSAAGRVVGQSGENLIEVEMRGVAGVPDGIYSAPSQKGAAAKAILNLEGTNVKTGNIKKSIAKEDEIDISTVQVAAQPSGWTPRNTADGEPKEWSSEDGLVVRQFADSYVAYDTDSTGSPVNEIARGESWADIQKATADYEKRDTPAPAASQGTNARSSDRATSTQLQPTDSLKEAKATGRPLSILRPGTMPKRTQAAYDSIVQSIDGGYEKARELRQKHKELFDGLKEKEASKNTYTSEENAILNEFNDSLVVTEFQWNELSEAIKEDYTAAKDGEESAFTEQEVADIVEAITRPLDYRHKMVVNNARAIKDGGQDIYSDELRLQNSAEVLEKADIAIAFPLEFLEKLITDGRFKTQFETNTSGGTLYPQGRMQGDIAQFGYHPRTAPETRPVYGYLTKNGIIDDENFDAIQMYGELQFVLKKDAHSRATYTTQNSLGTGLVPSPMGVPSKDASGAVGSPMAIYAEAQVHGGVNLSDVDYVVVNVGERQPWATHKVSEEQFESVSKMLESAGIRVVPVRDGEVVNTWDGGKIVSGPSAPAPAPAPESAQGLNKLPNNSVSLEKEASMSFAASDYDLEKAKAELENPVNAAVGQVWNIGGKKIHFGMEKDRNVVKYGEDMDDVEIVPINPYKIAGIEMGSEEGKELALKWAYARSALSSNDGTGYKSTSEVDALLYAGARGDEASSARLEELAEIGKQKVEKIKSEAQAALKDIEPKSETNLKEQIAKGLVSEKDQKAAERILGGSIDDLYVVHQTEYAFPIDDEGNIALKPASAYPTTLEDGKEIFVPRHTIHTALNHVVDPIKERGWPPNSHIAIIPLRALLEANPGSIDNILAEDTFFTPEAGGVLKFPAGSYKTLSNVADIVSAREQVSEAIRELSRVGSYGAQGDEIEPIIFEEGIMEISNTDARRAAFNALLQRISVDLGITNQIHMGTNSSLLDRAGDQDSQMSQNIERFFTPDFLSNLSINQIMRLTVGRDRSLYSAETQESRAAQQQQSVV
jgi:hypothetical protein